MQHISESYINRSRLRRRLARFIPAIQKVLVVIVFSMGIYATYSIIYPTAKALRQIIRGPSSVLSVVRTKDTDLKSINGRTNTLLLGIGDPAHDGPNLSDTMIVVSIDLKSKDTVLISIPRDVWVPSLKEKINTAYAIGEAKQKGGGFILAKASTSEILNLPIHYAARVNFSGFKKAIDLVDSIDINVDDTFDDYKYPIEGKENDQCDGDLEYKCRYEHIHFDKGLQRMDGQTSLKYVRSRYAEGLEGTDFARSRRQQKILLALKNKILSLETFLTPGKISKLMEIFGDNIDTDIDLVDASKFAKLLTKVDMEKTRSFILDTGDEKTERAGLLVNPPISAEHKGAWVLIPRDETWETIQNSLYEFLTDQPQQ